MLKFFILLFMCMLSITGCEKAEKPAIETAVDNFYTGNYEYQKTKTYFDGEDEKNQIIKGEVIQSPYKEFVEIVQSDSANMWSEAYYYGTGDVINASLNIDGTWTETKMKREKPYGYGEKLKFTLLEKRQDEEIYTTEYVVDIGKHYNLSDKEELSATIKQTYYLDTKENVITCIETNLTDLKEKTYIANEISANQKTVEEAYKTLKESGLNLTETEQLTILKYDDKLKIDIPFDL